MLAGLAGDDRRPSGGCRDAAERNRLGALLRTPGAVVLVGERAAQTPGLLTAVGDLVDATGAGLAWVPRRAGERGALDAGALGIAAARRSPAGRSRPPGPRSRTPGARPFRPTPGRDTAGILAAVGIAEPEMTDSAGGRGCTTTASRRADDPATGRPARRRVAGHSDLPDPAAALAAVASAGFVVSLELRASAVTELADVVFPVAAAVEKSGAYLNWEGRLRPFDAALPEAGTLDEGRILDTLGVEMDVDLYTQTPAAAAGRDGPAGRGGPGRARARMAAVPEPVSASAMATASAVAPTARCPVPATGWRPGG